MTIKEIAAIAAGLVISGSVMAGAAPQAKCGKGSCSKKEAEGTAQ